MRARLLCFLLACASCGRSGFDAIGDGRDGDDGSAATPDAASCTSSEGECVDATTLRCAGGGQDTTCAWGCLSTPMPHCGSLLPSGGGLGTNDITASGLSGTIEISGTINTDDGSITGGVTTRAAGTGIIGNIEYARRGSISMFRFANLRIVGTLSVVGSRAVAFISDQGILVNAPIDATTACNGRTGGPGGYSGGNVQSGGMGPGGGLAPTGTAGNGGGGGGHGGNGGRGGGAMAIAGGNANGVATIATLVGGSGGAGAQFLTGASGGGGGGAIQLVSNVAITISASGAINASGCGGGTTTGNDGGGGGGGGGAILLEAPTIMIAGALAVNGGSGGGGGNNGTRGSNGTPNRTPASAGTGAAVGGVGAAGATAVGANGATSGPDGGGGGGGIGRIRMNTRTGQAVVDNTQLSPSFTDAASTCTQGAATVQ